MTLKLDTIPASCPWRMYAGDANRQTLQFLRNGMPMDLTDHEFRAQARISATSIEIAMTATIDASLADRGVITVSWDGELMRDLLDENGRWSGTWDFQMIEPDMTLPRTILAGPVSIVSDVTRVAP
jgi:hypothetical protein